MKTISCPLCKSPDYTVHKFNQEIKKLPSIILCNNCQQFYRIKIEFSLIKMKLVDDISSTKSSSIIPAPEKTSIISIREQAKLNRALCWQLASEGNDIEQLIILTGFKRNMLYQYLGRERTSRELVDYPKGFKIGYTHRKAKKTDEEKPKKKKPEKKKEETKKKKINSGGLFDDNGNLKVKTRTIGGDTN